MASDFTVIIKRREHFGDGSVSLPGAYIGNHETYYFDCPKMSREQWAVLMFQSLSVDHDKNVLKVNGHDIPGGIPQTAGEESDWTGNVMLIPSSWLKDSGNELFVQSRTSDGAAIGDIDDFVLDNVVVLYKTS